MPDVIIRCPTCHWQPDDSCRWVCDVCKTRWNTFHTGGTCPGCGKVYLDTQCSKRLGGCGQMSPHNEWYEELLILKTEHPKRGFDWFWKSKNLPPVTHEDRRWLEQTLVWLTGLFGPVYMKQLTTVGPEQFSDWKFTGTEEDANFLFDRLALIMGINPWELQLKFYSEAPSKFAEGITATASGTLRNTWKDSVSKFEDNGIGNKIIWIELRLFKNTEKLIATVAHELAHYKLLVEGVMASNDKLLIDLATVASGLGIFSGNSYFKFVQWTGSTHQGWQMEKGGFLPEQMIAYAMAWLAIYREEDISWAQFFNRTMKKYFEQSYSYIKKNKAAIEWPGD